MKSATIIGGGLVGSLWAVYLAKAGYKVDVYERRPDMRKTKMSAGKSINLATSYRGWKALDAVGIGDEIRKIALPMYGRSLHHLNGSVNYQPYGINDQAIYSVSRGDINSKLMDLAEETKQVNIHFNEECTNVDLIKGTAFFKNTQSGAITECTADVVFATDGAFSAARYTAMQKLDRFNYSQHYIEDGYREILLPANADGSPKLETNRLHIWPRGRFMLIALPNFDNSFTCTLFMPFEGSEHCFNKLTDKTKVEQFFNDVFPDFIGMMPNVADAWDTHPLSALAIIRCYPWFYGKVMLMGDAAHATVPFFGQGMNCGFEDCTVMWNLMQKHNEDWKKIGEEYQALRKPNGDAVQDLSLQNYLVMRNKVADADFQLLQKVERRINELYPDRYFPLYTMVSFTDIEYRTALEKGNAQEQTIKDLITKNRITASSTLDEIDVVIHKHMQNTVLAN